MKNSITNNNRYRYLVHECCNIFLNIEILLSLYNRAKLLNILISILYSIIGYAIK